MAAIPCVDASIAARELRSQKKGESSRSKGEPTAPKEARTGAVLQKEIEEDAEDQGAGGVADGVDQERLVNVEHLPYYEGLLL